ncbi:MAG: hypothetical protein FWC14_04875 [Candidatus Bathyarchaeota archaeon]|uniref:hypothetical protein n=1 Tax=Candidatus Bathycorpusculum sp. TaxID=2994959 RepID=UPI00282665FA|nr:hypothetical protein [Candidatus Termiticorpusculum sp.]MCL2292359.1 hypothetical protein [Candidatus Termiticorpusculum sp.]
MSLELNPGVEKFRQTYKKDKPQSQVAFVKKLLVREYGRDLLAEAVTKSMNEPTFVGKLLGNEQGLQILVDALKRGMMKDKEFAGLVFNEGYAIVFNSTFKDKSYKDFKQKNKGATLFRRYL